MDKTDHIYSKDIKLDAEYSYNKEYKKIYNLKNKLEKLYERVNKHIKEQEAIMPKVGNSKFPYDEKGIKGGNKITNQNYVITHWKNEFECL